MTVNQLHKALGKLIEKGHKRKKVCVSKDTFTHACESDGCTILDVDHVEVTAVLQIQDDGSGTDENGVEHYRTCCVLYGDNHNPTQ